MSRETGRKAASGRGTAGKEKPPPADEVAHLPFEEALAQLERIVEELEQGSLPLEDALARFERGIQLSRHLEKQLQRAEARVRKLVGEKEGEPVLREWSGPGEEEGDADDDAEASETDGDPKLPF